MKSSIPPILICPLNWGLGHATRCIPLIRKYQNQRKTIHIASDGVALALLRKEFPKLTFHKLPSYDIRYSEGGLNINFLGRLPGIWNAIRKENKVVADLHSKYRYKLIISDNRYGCFSKKCKSVLVTHQLQLKTSFRPLSYLLNRIQRRYFGKFDEIWVPDFQYDKALAGDLSKNSSKLNTKYIGTLSRMRKLDIPMSRDILVVLSGPEPQRAMLEDLVISQLKLLPYSALVIRGLPEENVSGEIDGIEFRSYATSKELEEYMNSSRLVICRPGYTSIMDLHHLGKKAILVPTPGQFEQKYLADLHDNQTDWIARSQANLDLKSAIENLVRSNQESGIPIHPMA